MSDPGYAIASLSATGNVCASCGHPVPATGQADPLETAGPEDFEATESVKLAPGTLLAGRYRITTLIGHGGMGEVYQAYDVTLEQVIALKFLPRHLQADRRALARFHREVSLARKISHPNVCRVFDVVYAEGLAFITMEYVAGDDLRGLLDRIGHLPYNKALEVARQLCAGLAAAHDEGVLHRDLKPANIMLDRRGNVRITDFGLAAPFGEHDFSPVGTPVYMAPEQVRGQQITVRSDLYSLGLVLHEIFTGEPAPLAVACHAEGLALAGLSPAVGRMVLQCLESDPARRPQSAAAVAEALAGRERSGVNQANSDAPIFSKDFAWFFFTAALLGLAGFLFLAMRAAVEFGVFNQPAANPPAVLFIWAWCISAQAFLVFLSVGWLLRGRLTGSK